ncbi:MAG: dTMP kinase [Deltaproteobacteria bacterium]
MKRGIFVTFEGAEKSGKSTQARLLCAHLRRTGRRVLFVREPGSTVIGEKVRRLLLDRRHDRMTATTEMLLYMAARAQLVEEVIRPALARGTVVICDRFLDSTLAYQGFGCGMATEAILGVGRVATGGMTPDLTLLLDFGRSRENLKNEKARDRIEARPDAFHRRVKQGYRALARRFPRRIKIVRVHEDRNATQAHIRQLIDTCLSKRSSDTRTRSAF